ncbi:MAG: cation acetate symporter [Pirellulaceae bacterium]|nr:cation acetate symporter [Pirellulaceae bacterium]
MIHDFSWTAVAVFGFFVSLVLGLSFYLGSKAKSAAGYYAAHGQIPWFVNGVAFAGDYLSAASFLGICGMIAFYGYDGFLYSIGFLAGWIVALLVIAEPLKRLGKFTFADALDSQFNSRGIKLAAAISTLVVSIFYLIPQMVGAGALVKPLLGLSDFELGSLTITAQAIGVILVGSTVTLIVTTAGMVSTTWVQFLKGGLLVIFCTILTVMILNRGLIATPEIGECQKLEIVDGKRLVNGLPQGHGEGEADFHPVGTISRLPNDMKSTGPLNPLSYIATLQASDIVTWPAEKKGTTTTFCPKVRPGSELLTPGGSPTFKGIRSDKLADKLDFLSLMIALFCGTASLPHILIRYYTVKDQASARKSTVVGIASIGFFYVLTLFLGLGAMTSGVLDPTESNMAAPLLARSFGELPFAIISAIAFTTVLGTVSGLILAASGAVAHDLLSKFFQLDLSDHAKVRAGKVTAVVVGIVAMILGILFQGFNTGFLVGWAFNVAASANLPALVMLLFWRGTTKQGITAAIFVGMFASLGWILLSQQCYKDVYGLDPTTAIVPFSQPGIVTIPLGFAVLIVVSLLTRRNAPAQ